MKAIKSLIEMSKSTDQIPYPELIHAAEEELKLLYLDRAELQYRRKQFLKLDRAIKKAKDMLGAELNHDMLREERQHMNFQVYKILEEA